jgi:DNA-binding response OmpR family regulator
MLRLLVVDDEVDICGFVKGFFSERGFAVTSAYNGVEALEAVERERPDIMLLDVKMPVMDGLETLRRIRENSGTMMVIMITAIDEAETAEQAWAHGVTEYITKPLVLEQLEKTVFAAAEQIRTMA